MILNAETRVLNLSKIEKQNYWCQKVLAKYNIVVKVAYFVEKFCVKSFTQPFASMNFPFTVLDL